MALTRPPQNPNIPEESVILSKFSGLKNTLKPERLGPQDLARARDVDLDDDGQLSRRRGVTLKKSGVAHSLFTTAYGVTFVVFDGALGVLRPDYSFHSIQTGIGSDPNLGGPGLAYTQVGTNLYYSGPVNSGVVDLTALTAGPWQGQLGGGQPYWLSPVVNPTATLPAIRGQLIGPPPNATSLAYLSGRIYLAQGPTLWSTEPWLYTYVDKVAGNVTFEGDITMLGAVGDGLYVGTTEGVYFLEGFKFPQKKTRVMDSGVIPGSLTYIPGELGNPPQVGLGVDTPVQVSIAFMTTAGFCVGQDGGQCTNMTETKFWFPSATSVAAMFRRQDGKNQYVATLQGIGSNTAAIGDYIEATLIRAADIGANPFVPQPVAPLSNVSIWSVSTGLAIGDVLSYRFLPGGGGVMPGGEGDDRITEDGYYRTTEDGYQRTTE